MLPTIEEAEKELHIAGVLNPGPWIKHSLNVGIAARNIARKIPSLDENKAYIVGILHDIGRRTGIVNIPMHVYEGYKLIQLCDSLATDYGFVIIEKRFVDVTRRYGIMKSYIEGWNKIFKIKENFENMMGCSVYDVLPDIGKTTLLSPPLWNPEA